MSYERLQSGQTVTDGDYLYQRDGRDLIQLKFSKDSNCYIPWHTYSNHFSSENTKELKDPWVMAALKKTHPECLVYGEAMYEFDDDPNKVIAALQKANKAFGRFLFANQSAGDPNTIMDIAHGGVAVLFNGNKLKGESDSSAQMSEKIEEFMQNHQMIRDWAYVNFIAVTRAMSDIQEVKGTSLIEAVAGKLIGEPSEKALERRASALASLYSTLPARFSGPKTREQLTKLPYWGKMSDAMQTRKIAVFDHNDGLFEGMEPVLVTDGMHPLTLDRIEQSGILPLVYDISYDVSLRSMKNTMHHKE